MNGLGLLLAWRVFGTLLLLDALSAPLASTLTRHGPAR